MEKGLTYTAVTTVTADNTAAAVGSGDMDVFATPVMAALMEQASMLAVAQELPEGSTTVGCELNIKHVRATPAGARVSAAATLTDIDGRRLTFAVQACDERGPIGEGTHIRVIVDRKRFMEKALAE